jgi:hypothetical protein
MPQGLLVFLLRCLEDTLPSDQVRLYQIEGRWFFRCRPLGTAFIGTGDTPEEAILDAERSFQGYKAEIHERLRERSKQAPHGRE